MLFPPLEKGGRGDSLLLCALSVRVMKVAWGCSRSQSQSESPLPPFSKGGNGNSNSNSKSNSNSNSNSNSKSKSTSNCGNSQGETGRVAAADVLGIARASINVHAINVDPINVGSIDHESHLQTDLPISADQAPASGRGGAVEPRTTKIGLKPSFAGISAC